MARIRLTSTAPRAAGLLLALLAALAVLVHHELPDGSTGRAASAPMTGAVTHTGPAVAAMPVAPGHPLTARSAGEAAAMPCDGMPGDGHPAAMASHMCQAASVAQSYKPAAPTASGVPTAMSHADGRVRTAISAAGPREPPSGGTVLRI